MLQKETGQMEDTIIMDNIVRLSSEHNVPLSIETKTGKVCTGILKALMPIGAGITTSWMFYLRRDDAENPKKEVHSMVALSDVSAIEFVTEKGFLDNLIP